MAKPKKQEPDLLLQIVALLQAAEIIASVLTADELDAIRSQVTDLELPDPYISKSTLDDTQGNHRR